MGNCCGKNRAAAQTRRYAQATGSNGKAEQAFTLLFRDGRTQHFGSRLEADAENARQGYTGIVRQNGR